MESELLGSPKIGAQILTFNPRSPAVSNADLLCFSHLRWDFVYQRPQHLLTSCAGDRKVYFFEEPVWSDESAERLEVKQRGRSLSVIVPVLPRHYSRERAEEAQRQLLDGFLKEKGLKEYLTWYYTPMALSFTRHLQPVVSVYDCMDELSHFKGAPPELRLREEELLSRVDIVFTGGQTLFEAKQGRHKNLHCFPSSVDREHFAQARKPLESPPDQMAIPRPRIGFFGVLDERLDIDLLRGIAALRPQWSFILIGPVVKIDPADLPRASNIFYLGGKKYEELPAYLSGWGVAMLPFARNEATRFISPTKTPEYLAAAKPVVSTSIRDVVRPYGEMGLVEIADHPEEFISAIERLLSMPGKELWKKQVDEWLSHGSWDMTWERMNHLIQTASLSRARENRAV